MCWWKRAKVHLWCYRQWVVWLSEHPLNNSYHASNVCSVSPLQKRLSRINWNCFHHLSANGFKDDCRVNTSHQVSHLFLCLWSGRLLASPTNSILNSNSDTFLTDSQRIISKMSKCKKNNFEKEVIIYCTEWMHISFKCKKNIKKINTLCPDYDFKKRKNWNIIHGGEQVRLYPLQPAEEDAVPLWDDPYWTHSCSNQLLNSNDRTHIIHIISIIDLRNKIFLLFLSFLFPQSFHFLFPLVLSCLLLSL